MQTVDPGSVAITPPASAIAIGGQPVALRVLYALNPAGPFYPFVLTYLIASAGLTPTYDANNYSEFLRGVNGVFPGRLSDTAQVDLAECVALARSNALPQQQAEIRMCCMLANAAYESIPETVRMQRTNSPVFQFLRHVRHAASHGNRWHFLGTEPKNPAEWKGLRLNQTLHNMQCFYGTIAPADLLYLLQDVERLL